jgi:hypothetical protein
MFARGTAVAVALSAALVPGARGDEGRPAPVPLVWLDGSGVTVGVDGVARDECRSVLKRAGIDATWRRGAGGEAARPGEIRIIVVEPLVVATEQQRYLLGATPVREREHPVAWVHLASVQATLGFPPGFPILDLPLGARRDLGVALGRVAAHEVVHVLVPTLKHGDGLMSRTLTPDKLKAARLSLEPIPAELLRDALAGRTAPARAGDGVLAVSGAVESDPRP